MSYPKVHQSSAGSRVVLDVAKNDDNGNMDLTEAEVSLALLCQVGQTITS